MNPKQPEERLLSPDSLVAWRAQAGTGARVAVVTGTFDILQPGNLWVLRRASQEADFVVVVLESDADAAQHTQPGRPQHGLETRAEMVAHLAGAAVVTSVSVPEAGRFFGQLSPFAWVTARAPREKEAFAGALTAAATSVIEVEPLSGCFTEDIVGAIRNQHTPIRLPEGRWPAPFAATGGQPGERPGDVRVTVNGCFDILHVGHLRFLAEARALGDSLTVLINDDRSVARYKGPTRPVFPERFRAAALKSLASVDDVMAFAEDEPLAAITRLRPDIHVKGGSFEPDRVRHEKELVESWGGRLMSMPMVEGFSTSAYIRKALGMRHSV